MKYYLLYFCLFFIAGCASSWRKFDIKETPIPSDYPVAEAVVLLDEGEMFIREDNTAIFKHRRIIKILTSEGQNYAYLSLPFNSYSDIKKIRGRTIKSDGKCFNVDISKIVESSSFPKFILFSDAKIKSFKFPKACLGSCIEYEYEREIKSLFYWNAWNFQKEIPTLESRYILSVPKDFDFDYKTLNIEIQPQIEKQDERIIYIWEANNLPAISKEPSMPSIGNIIAKIEFFPQKFKIDKYVMDCSNWKNAACSERNLLEPQIKSNNEISEVVDSLISGIHVVEEKIKIIYEFVKSKIHYVAIEIGIGGIEPHPASEVFSNYYGDCKDMSVLLVTMFREAGIESYPALVRTNSYGKLEDSIPSLNQFNHAIVCVPNDTGYIWFDPTSDLPFGEIPNQIQGVLSLISDGELIEIPISQSARNQKLHIKLSSNGLFLGNGTITMKGQNGVEMQTFLKRKKIDERREFFEKLLTNRCASCILQDLSISLDFPIRFDFTFKGDNKGQIVGNEIFFTPNFFGRLMPMDAFSKKKRTYPVFFDYSYTKIDDVTVEFPEGYSPMAVPQNNSLENSYGSFTCSYSVEENNIHFHRELVWKKNEIPVTDYSQVKSFYEKVLEEDAREIVLTKK